MKNEEGKMRQIFDGVYSIGRNIYTENLAPGKKVYGERLLRSDKEYREWEPTRSKLAAAIINGLKNMPIQPGSKVLYLGASTGTTVSHVSDILQEKGAVYAVEFSERVFREFLKVASARINVIPILADARKPANYDWIEQCDILFCDLAQPDETEIAVRAANEFLAECGFLMLSVKSQSIDVSKQPQQVYKEEAEKLIKSGFEILETVNLEPHEQKHALIVARKR
jgi:fibrillarin-like pre-rRNA processing protein